MMSESLRQEGIELAVAAQFAKNRRDSAQEWTGDKLLKDRILQAIESKSTSIVGYLRDYQEPDIDAIEEEILIEQAWGSEEFGIALRVHPDSLGCFEVMLRYPPPRNPRGAGRKKTGHRADLSLCGLSDRAFGRLNREALAKNRSAYIVSLVEADNR